VFKSLSIFSLLLLILTAALFPSEGTRALFNPKAIALVLFVLSFTAYFLTERKVEEKELLTVGGFFLLLSGISFWILLALSGGIEAVAIIDETKLFLITFLPFFGATILYNRGALKFSTFIKTLLYANSLYTFAKVGFLLLVFLKIVSFSTFIEVTGIRVMSLDVAGSFNRFLTSCDLFTPFLLFFVAARKSFNLRLNRLFVYFYIPVSLLSIAIAFSRVFLFIGFASLVLALLLQFQKKAIFALYVSIFFCLGVTALLGPEKVASMLELRLFSRENTASDKVRAGQIEALVEETANHPLLGLGMGGYSREVIRDNDVLHLYEVQWLALLAQFGFLGVPLLLSPVFAIFFSFLKGIFSVERLFLFILFLGWLAAGTTNPFVLSLASGVMYTLFFLGLKELEACHSYPIDQNIHPSFARVSGSL